MGTYLAGLCFSSLWWAQRVGVVFELIFHCFLVHSIQVQYGWLLMKKTKWKSCFKKVDFGKIVFPFLLFFNRMWSKGELACKSQASLPMLQLKVRHFKAKVASYHYIPTNFICCLYLLFFHYIFTKEIAAPLSIFCRIELFVQNCTEPKCTWWWHNSLILGSVLSQSVFSIWIYEKVYLLHIDFPYSAAMWICFCLKDY